MIARMPIVAVTLRALLDRKRTWLMVGLAAIPVVLVAMATMLSDATVESEDFDSMIIATVLPLVALVFGTAALGSEIEEGTIVYLLTKPVRRLRIVASKTLVAALLTGALMVTSTLLTGLVATMGGSDVGDVALAYAVAAALGGTAYTVVFLALSAFTRWALAIGLVYVLIWEGILADLLPGTNTFSIRQATLGVSSGLADDGYASASLEQGLLTLALFVVVGVGIATWRMSRFQLKGGD